MVIWECFEELHSLGVVRMAALCGLRLTRPKYSYIVRVAFVKCLSVLMKSVLSFFHNSVVPITAKELGLFLAVFLAHHL